MRQGEFFCSSLVQEPEATNFYELFVPSNPFYSLSQNLVPAVVVFCLCLGIALLTLPEKELLVRPLEILANALTRITKAVAALAPVGVFAIMADVAGTMSVAELAKLQAYAITYLAAIILPTFWILPMLLASCTPIRYREVLRVTGQPLIIGAATGAPIVALPMLIERTAALLAAHGVSGEEAESHAAGLYPLAFPFPNISRFAAFLFVPFVAWFLGQTFPVRSVATLAALGVPVSFAKPTLFVPFLLDTFHLPADMFQLFVAVHAQASRIGDMLTVMHLFAFVVLSGCISYGCFHINWRRILILVVGSVVLFAAVIGGTRGLLASVIHADQQKASVLEKMHGLTAASDATVHRSVPPREPTAQCAGKRLATDPPHGNPSRRLSRK